MLCNSPVGSRHQRLVRELVSRVREDRLRFWTACISHNAIPSDLQAEALSTPLRSAPVVLREVAAGFHKFNDVHRYNDSDLPSPGDGLKVIQLSHHGDGHTGRWPVECVQCGEEVALELRRLGVGIGGK